MLDLTSKVAVITGGASGIGLAMAETFGRAGMRLVIADISQNSIDVALPGLVAKGIEVVGVRTDVARYDEMEALADVTLRAYGKAHVIVNNAGVSITGPTWQMSLDDWRWVYDVNVWGVIHGIKAFMPILVRQDEPGHVINTASLASFYGTGEHAPYCSSKAACLSISQALYSELTATKSKIGVSVVCPGMVATDIHRSWRNRPAGDQPWSDREWADSDHIARSRDFQASGTDPAHIAQATLDAVREDRFYVFYGAESKTYVQMSTRPAVRAENPFVVTWGPDLREAPAPRRASRRAKAKPPLA